MKCKNGVWRWGSRDNETKDKEAIAQVSRWYKVLQLQENPETSWWTQGLETNRVKHNEWRDWKWGFTPRKEDGWVHFYIKGVRGNKMFLSKWGLGITPWICCQPAQWQALGKRVSSGVKQGLVWTWGTEYCTDWFTQHWEGWSNNC